MESAGQEEQVMKSHPCVTILSAFAMSLVASSSGMADVCRVDDDGCGCDPCDGSDWTTNCFQYLQDAMADSSCTEIWSRMTVQAALRTANAVSFV